MIFNMLVVWNLDTPTIIVLAMSTAIAQNIASKHRQPRIQIPQSLWSRSAVNYELQPSYHILKIYTTYCLSMRLLLTDMGVAESDGSYLMESSKYSLNTTSRIKAQLSSLDIVLHIGDITYALGYSSMVRKHADFHKTNIKINLLIFYVANIIDACMIYGRTLLTTAKKDANHILIPQVICFFHICYQNC